MDTKNTSKPWNEYHGLTEGDMLDELVEHDAVRFGVPERENREVLEGYTAEEIRKSWWYSIGRHMS